MDGVGNDLAMSACEIMKWYMMDVERMCLEVCCLNTRGCTGKAFTRR